MGDATFTHCPLCVSFTHMLFLVMVEWRSDDGEPPMRHQAYVAPGGRLVPRADRLRLPIFNVLVAMQTLSTILYTLVLRTGATLWRTLSSSGSFRSCSSVALCREARYY